MISLFCDNHLAGIELLLLEHTLKIEIALFLATQNIQRFLICAGAETDSIARARLSEQGKIRPNHGRYLCISARSLAVCQHDYGHAVCRYVNSAFRQSIGNDVCFVRMFDLWSLEPVSHPIGFI